MSITLSWRDLAALSPLLTLLLGSLMLLLGEAFASLSAKRFFYPFTFIILLVALGLAIEAPASDHPILTAWLRFDNLARLFTLFFLVIGLGTVSLASHFFRRFKASQGEYYFFLLSALFGLLLIGSAADFLTLFLGFETLSIALYILCSYMKSWKISHESSLKYFLLGSLAAAFLLYGIALIYGAVGTTRFDQLLPAYRQLSSSSSSTLFLTGILFVTIGLSFKAAIIPFHTWAPDVYDGAPTPVTAFMAIGTKVGAFAAFIRVFFDALPLFNATWSQGLSLLIYPTLLYANFVALKQNHLRRFFAYSSISHSGFLLIGVVVGTSEALSALLFYLVIYAIATFGCFAVLISLDKRREGLRLEDLKGLYYRAPLHSFIFTICLLTLAGIPPTVGFFTKFYLFKLALQADYFALVVVALLTTILSAYYYLRLITLILSKQHSHRQESTIELEKPFISLPAIGIIATITLLILSFYPALLLNYF